MSGERGTDGAQERGLTIALFSDRTDDFVHRPTAVQLLIRQDLEW